MAIMKNILAASVLGLACVVAATRGFAQENPGFTQREIMRDPGLLGGATPPQIPTYQSRIPAPLPPPRSLLSSMGPCRTHGKGPSGF
jgi:hypothetical protein